MSGWLCLLLLGLLPCPCCSGTVAQKCSELECFVSTLTVCTILFLSLPKALFDFSNCSLIFLIVFFPLGFPSPFCYFGLFFCVLPIYSLVSPLNQIGTFLVSVLWVFSSFFLFLNMLVGFIFRTRSKVALLNGGVEWVWMV